MKKRTKYSITSMMISLTLVAPTLTGIAPSSPVQAEERMKEIPVEELTKGKAQTSKPEEQASFEKDDRPVKQVHKKERSKSSKQVEDVNLKDVHNRGILIEVKESSSFLTDAYEVNEGPLSEALKRRHFRLLEVKKDADYHQVLQQLKDAPSVLTADPDYISESSYVPSDPEYSGQYQYDDMNMEKAWNVTRGSSDTTVAVLDTGVYKYHEDLQGTVLPGYDFVNNDANPDDNHGHGTHIAGLIAANFNDMGIAGLAPDTKILPVKVGDYEGKFSDSDVLAGIYYAIDKGVDVINMSFGAYHQSDAEERALWEAYNEGIVLVAAASNDGIRDASYPASYFPVISVAATERSGYRAAFSNYGTWVDLTAPGVYLTSTSYMGGYSSMSGTSFSAPLVAGLAAMIKGENPDWNPGEIEWAMEKHAQTPNASRWDEAYGYGIPDAYEVVTSQAVDLSDDVSNNQGSSFHLEKGEPKRENLDTPNDSDWYDFRVDHPTTVSVDVTSRSDNEDLVVAVFNRYGERQVFDGEWKGSGESFTFEADPGMYTVMVYDYYNHWSDESYVMEVNWPDHPYKDEVVYEQEPNEFASSATPLSYEKAAVGTFDPADLDYYKVDFPYAGSVDVTLASSAAASHIDPEVTVAAYDQDGNMQTIEAAAQQSEQDGVTYLTATIEKITRGPYYLIVKNGTGEADRNENYVLSMEYNEKTFPDVTGTWAEPYVSYLSRENLMTGYPDGTFGFYDPITRAGAATMIARELDLPRQEADFPDVPDHHWGTEYIGALAEAGILSGYEDGTFHPNGTLTRAEMATLVVRAYELTGESASSFPDVKADSWAASYIDTLVANDVIKGFPDGTYRPNQPIKRSEFAVIMAKLLSDEL
ncbi:S8 family serine peptidase [Halobacillus halophilus]|uniref:S8 family serine peptidase n=1 Tax=Halobacillus halophilus TaxID=1570 RepID=UPI001CD58BC1|nr:S8 family serine peptidase [Halobacillus halophilus]MCA1010740.1 S8 family serine peptidase [Halobacillus halophilus]